MRASLICLFCVFASTAHAIENPLLKAMNSVARFFGASYSPGYHSCQCTGPCLCNSNAAVHYQHEANYAPIDMGYGDVMQKTPTPAAPIVLPQAPPAPLPTPEYMQHTAPSISDEYNKPIEKPERKYVPKDEEPKQVINAPTLASPKSVKVPQEESEVKEGIRSPSDRQVEIPPSAPLPVIPKQPSLPKPPGNMNDDNLLVPPDTGLLDSISYPRPRVRSLPTRPMRTARRVIMEP